MIKFCIFSCVENHQIEMIRTKVQKEVELGVLGQGSLRIVELVVQLGKRKNVRNLQEENKYAETQDKLSEILILQQKQNKTVLISQCSLFGHNLHQELQTFPNLSK